MQKESIMKVYTDGTIIEQTEMDRWAHPERWRVRLAGPRVKIHYSILEPVSQSIFLLIKLIFLVRKQKNDETKAKFR